MEEEKRRFLPTIPPELLPRFSGGIIKIKDNADNDRVYEGLIENVKLTETLRQRIVIQLQDFYLLENNRRIAHPQRHFEGKIWAFQISEKHNGDQLEFHLRSPFYRVEITIISSSD